MDQDELKKRLAGFEWDDFDVRFSIDPETLERHQQPEDYVSFREAAINPHDPGSDSTGGRTRRSAGFSSAGTLAHR